MDVKLVLDTILRKEDLYYPFLAGFFDANGSVDLRLPTMILKLTQAELHLFILEKIRAYGERYGLYFLPPRIRGKEKQRLAGNPKIRTKSGVWDMELRTYSNETFLNKVILT